MRACCRRDERGALTILIVAFALGLALMIGAVTDVSAAYLHRQDVSSVADGAALAASDAAAAAAVYRTADDPDVVLDEQAARDAVDKYLRTIGAFAAYPGLLVDVAVSRYTVSVRLTSPYELPVRVPGVAAAITVHATSSAEMPIY